MTEHSYPEELEVGSNSGARYLGVEDGQPVYWNHQTNQLVKVGESPNELPVSEETFTLDNDVWVGRYVADAQADGAWRDSSALARFLAAVAETEDTPGMLGQRQAVVYALRQIEGLPVREIARALDVSQSTVYSATDVAAGKLDAFASVLSARPRSA
jgi:hypothetical protein